MEELEILAPPMFEPTGERMTGTAAILGGKWLGSANVWVFRFNDEDNEIQFLYQEREPNSPWMPGKLDVAAGGYFKAGESATAKTRVQGALRELRGELGLSPKPSSLRYITRRLNVGISQKGNERRTCCSIYAYELVGDQDILMRPDEESGVREVEAVYWIGIKDLLAMHADPEKVISTVRYAHNQELTSKEITAASFCPNYDDYLFTMPATIAAIVRDN